MKLTPALPSTKPSKVAPTTRPGTVVAEATPAKSKALDHFNLERAKVVENPVGHIAVPGGFSPLGLRMAAAVQSPLDHHLSKAISVHIDTKTWSDFAEFTARTTLTQVPAIGPAAVLQQLAAEGRVRRAATTGESVGLGGLASFSNTGDVVVNEKALARAPASMVQLALLRAGLGASLLKDVANDCLKRKDGDLGEVRREVVSRRCEVELAVDKVIGLIADAMSVHLPSRTLPSSSRTDAFYPAAGGDTTPMLALHAMNPELKKVYTVDLGGKAERLIDSARDIAIDRANGDALTQSTQTLFGTRVGQVVVHNAGTFGMLAKEPKFWAMCLDSLETGGTLVNFQSQRHRPPLAVLDVALLGLERHGMVRSEAPPVRQWECLVKTADVGPSRVEAVVDLDLGLTHVLGKLSAGDRSNATGMPIAETLPTMAPRLLRDTEGWIAHIDMIRSRARELGGDTLLRTVDAELLTACAEARAHGGKTGVGSDRETIFGHVQGVCMPSPSPAPMAIVERGESRTIRLAPPDLSIFGDEASISATSLEGIVHAVEIGAMELPERQFLELLERIKPPPTQEERDDLNRRVSRGLIHKKGEQSLQVKVVDD